MRAILALVPPDDQQIVRIVAQCLKVEEQNFHDTFFRMV